MKRFLNYAVIALLAGVFVPFVSAESHDSEKAAWTVFKNIPEKDNLVYSPYSLRIASAMLAAGAKNESKSELVSTLSVGDHNQISSQTSEILNDKDLVIYSANSLWQTKGLPGKPEYARVIKDSFGGDIQTVDFGDAGTVRILNDWIADKTSQLITDLIPPGAFTELTKFVIINAIYFKGRWLYPFDSSKTRKRSFSVSGTSVVEVPFMEKALNVAFVENESYAAIELPYAGGRKVMNIFLPDKGIPLAEVESRISSENIGEMFKDSSVKVDVVIPKFKIKSNLSLAQPLVKAGIKQVFNSSEADLSGIAGEPHQIFVDAIIQGATITTDEDGTEAAAATMIGMITSALPAAPQKTFLADRPFLYVLRDKVAGEILFMGRVSNPA